MRKNILWSQKFRVIGTFFVIYSPIVKKGLCDIHFSSYFLFKVELVSFSGLFFYSEAPFYSSQNFHKASQILLRLRFPRKQQEIFTVAC